MESQSLPGFNEVSHIYRGEKGGLAPQRERLPTHVDNHSLYTYIDRGFDIPITPTPNTLTNVMKLFLDTAIVSDIEERVSTGLIAVSYTHLTLPTSDLV